MSWVSSRVLSACATAEHPAAQPWAAHLGTCCVLEGLFARTVTVGMTGSILVVQSVHVLGHLAEDCSR